MQLVVEVMYVRVRPRCPPWHHDWAHRRLKHGLVPGKQQGRLLHADDLAGWA
jgi:hypothetical protein